jgi:hypothetical protein
MIIVALVLKVGRTTTVFFTSGLVASNVFAVNIPGSTNACRNALSFLGAFPMFVPSLSWYNDQFYA